MYSTISVQIQDKVISLTLRTNNHRKGMNPVFLPTAMANIVEKIGCFSLDRSTLLGEGKTLNSKPEGVDIRYV